jgi:hypothetical protein
LANRFDNSLVDSVKSTNLGYAFHLSQRSVEQPEISSRGSNDRGDSLSIHFW